MEIKDKITEITQGLLTDDGVFVVDVKVLGHKGSQKIVVLLDADKGLDVNTCSKTSRMLSEVLDQEDLLSGSYILEVSSPGIDQPLMLKRQYFKNIGRELKVMLNDNTLVQGVLLDASETTIKLEKKVKEKGKKVHLEEVELPFEMIQKSNVMVSF
ncbi:MAG: ribosome maturation factor RimP [Cyclobacteriaceae bacterium]